jgi:hypothetical protein
VMANPVYRNSAFYNSSDSAWLGTKNQFSLSTQKVMPGQNAVFTAIWKAPAAAGLYIEPFTVVLDGLQILPYAGMRFDIQVQ